MPSLHCLFMIIGNDLVCVEQDSSFKNIVFVCPPMNSYHDMEMTLETICKELNSHKLSFIVKENQNKEVQ